MRPVMSMHSGFYHHPFGVEKFQVHSRVSTVMPDFKKDTSWKILDKRISGFVNHKICIIPTAK